MQQLSPPDLTALSDGELLARFCESNEEEAFRAIVARHKTMVSSVCTSVLRNHADAEDSFQAAFFILARKAKSLQDKECIGGWLHRVALRCALTTVRRKTRRQEVSQTAECESQQTALERVATKAMQAALHEALDALPEKYRLPLILCYIEGMSCQEAARRMKLSETAIYKRLERGRQRLRSRLKALGVGGYSLLLVSSGTATALAGHVSAAKVNSTVFVAMQAKLAWAKGALATAGNQASLTLAQGVMKTMMMTTLLKSACSMIVGLSVGFVSMSTVALAQESSENEGNRIAIELAASDQAALDQQDAEVAANQDAKKIRVEKNRLVLTWTITNQVMPVQTVIKPAVVKTQTLTRQLNPIRVISQPKVVTASTVTRTLNPLQVVVQPKVVKAVTITNQIKPLRVVTRPQVVKSLTVTRNLNPLQVQLQPRFVEGVTVTMHPLNARVSLSPKDDVSARLESLESEVKRLSAQINQLIESLQDR